MQCDVMLTFSLPSMSTSLINQVQTVVCVIGTLEKHIERQQSENREAGALASVKEEDNEEELNVEESSAAGDDDLVQPTNDVTGDDGTVSPVLAATTIPTSEVAGGKKRSRADATSSTRNTRAQTTSKKRAKLPDSTLYETSEVAGTTAQTPELRMSARRASTNAHEGTFEGTSRVIEAEEEADDACMPIHEEDGSPLDDGDDDHGEDGKKVIIKRAQQGRSAIKSFDELFKDLMDFKDKFGHCDVSRKHTGEYQSLGGWCKNLRVSYNKTQKGEQSNRTLTEENIRQLENAGFKWSLDTRSTFDERYAELMAFKEKFGHCDVSRRESVEYQSLRGWCDKMRMAYKKIQKNERPHHTLTEDNIRQLENAGFKWRLRQSAYTS